MEFGELFSQNWFNFLSAVGIIGGLIFNEHSLRSETKTRRIANLLIITANHREIWKEFLNNPKLARVRDAAADPAKQPVTDAERLFVAVVIQHINSAYYTMSDKLVVNYEGFRLDIAQFFSLPIPKWVWGNIKHVQNDDFAKFIESILK